MFYLKSLLTLLIFAQLLGACATRSEVYSDYSEAIREAPVRERREREDERPTVILILVDGLSVPVTELLLKQGALPRIQKFFLDGKQAFPIGRAGFPTLTYPNISSILTTRDMDEQPVIGNQVLLAGKRFNFESPLQRDRLARMIRPYSVFAKLTEQKRTSVSFAHYFGDRATARYPTDYKAGLAYQRGDYAYIDEKLIDSMEKLLRRTDLSQWPEFIFLHVAGVDSLSHDQGPFSAAALTYASRLDRRLGTLFQLIERAERQGKKVATILTADHGAMAVTHYAAIEPVIRSLAPQATILNQHRLISVHNVPDPDSAAATLASAQSVQMTATRSGNEVRIYAGSLRYSLRLRNASCRESTYAVSWQSGPYLCPDEMDRMSASIGSANYPFMITNLARYFHSPYHPDLIVLAQPGVSFTPEALGHHGGLSPEELFVPTLLRNAAQKDPQQIRRTSELLAFVMQPAASAGMAKASEVTGPLSYVDQQVTPTSPRYTLKLSSPVSTWRVETRQLSNDQSRNLKSAPTLGFGGEFVQYWTPLLSTSEGYAFEFGKVTGSAYSTSGLGNSGGNTNSEIQLKQVVQLKAAYHFGKGQSLISGFGLRQRYFNRPMRSASGEDVSPILEKLWVPEIRFGTDSRIISLGIGDLSALGSLGLLAPRNLSTYSVEPGFSQEVGLKFGYGVGVADAAAVSLKLGHLTQNTSFEDQSETRLLLEMSYELTFQDH